MLDPHIGGPLDALAAVFGDTAGQLGGQAARSTVGAASEAAQGEIPKLAEVVRSQIPGLVGTAGAAARPFAHDLAGEAGKAAGEGAIDTAKTSAAPVVIGVVVVGGLLAAVLGYAASQHRRKGKAA